MTNPVTLIRSLFTNMSLSTILNTVETDVKNVFHSSAVTQAIDTVEADATSIFSKIQSIHASDITAFIAKMESKIKTLKDQAVQVANDLTNANHNLTIAQAFESKISGVLADVGNIITPPAPAPVAAPVAAPAAAPVAAPAPAAAPAA